MKEFVKGSQVEPAERPDQGIPHGMVALAGQGETRRNRLLRRVDWRFLAGKPHPRRAAAMGGMLAEALELVAQEVLPLEQAAPGSIDLAAFKNPNWNQLGQAWGALEPGGVLYGEWYFPRPGGAGALSRRLSKMGYRVADCYWPLPWPERATPAFWLPLEARGALRYFLGSRPRPHSWPARVVNRALHLAWRAGHAAGLLAPVCLIAYKPLPEGEAELPQGSLAKRAEGWGLAEAGQRLHWLLLTGGLHSINKVTGLVFLEDESTPSFVVKMPRRDLSLPALEREAEVLRAVHSKHPRRAAGVPELVFLDSQAGFPALGETHLAGAPLYTAMQPERLEQLAKQAARWLVDLVEPGPPQPVNAWWGRLVAPVLDDFAQSYGDVGGGEVLDAARPELDRLGPMNLAVEHRDFSPWNVFLAPSGDLNVLDWEGAEPQGLPFSDLLYFLAYLTFFAEGALENGSAPASYRGMLDPATRMGAIARGCFQDYCSTTGLPADALRPLRILTWLRHAVLERNLIANSSSSQPDPQLLRRGLYLSLLRTELEMDKDG